MESDTRDPRVRLEIAYWIDCSVCGPDADPPAPRFTSEADLWHELLRPDERGWIRLDDGRILCPVHRRVAECDRNGNAMSAWIEHPLDDGLKWRFCLRCGSQFGQRISKFELRAES